MSIVRMVAGGRGGRVVLPVIPDTTDAAAPPPAVTTD